MTRSYNTFLDDEKEQNKIVHRKVDDTVNTMSTSNVNSEGNKRPILNLDKILVEEIGQFGKFQIRVIAQCIFAVFFVAWNINEFVFTTARIATRCLIPECEGTTSTEFAPPWITNAVPTTSGAVDNCQRYGNSSAPSPDNSTCPASLFNTSVLQPCDEYLYQNTNTVVYDFDLACDEWRRALIGSVRVIGMVFALALTGYVSDRWGRRRALAINASSAAVLGVLRYWAPSYPAYVLIMFIESVVGGGLFTCSYVMTVELLGPKYRVMGGAICNTCFAVGQILLGLIAWAVSDWRSLILALYLPQLLSIFYFWTLNESVRWLISKGKFQETEDLLKEVARVNGKELSPKTLDDLRINTEEDKKMETKKNEPSLVLIVLKDKRILLRCFVSCMWYITATFVYYGLSFNAVNLTGNMYLNYMTAAVVEIPGCWTVFLIIDKIGRKATLISFLWLCTACQVAFIFIPDDLATLSLIAYMVGKWAIAVVITSINIYTLELFPTESRHRLYAFTTMVGRAGPFLASLTPALGETIFVQLPFILFGGMAFLTSFLTFLMPETLGSKLPDTMEEALSIEPGGKNVKTTQV